MDKKDLATWFESLSKEEKEVVKLRFGIDGEEPLTLKEISLKLGKKVNNNNIPSREKYIDLNNYLDNRIAFEKNQLDRNQPLQIFAEAVSNAIF